MGTTSDTNILQYAELLNQHGVGSSTTEQFKRSHAADAVAVRRMELLDRLFGSKARVLQSLHAADAEPLSMASPAQPERSSDKRVMSKAG